MKKHLTFLLTSLTILSMMMPIAPPVEAQTAAPAAFCYTFVRNLGIGKPMSAPEGRALSTALSSAGAWDSSAPITAYTNAVASAVSKFQEGFAAAILTPNGLSRGTGFVGVSTRAKLNALYACSPSAQTAQNICPSGYTCTPAATTPVAFVCPSGYKCSPVAPVTIAPPPVACPTGFVCTYNRGNPQNGICPADYICSVPSRGSAQGTPPVSGCPVGYSCSPGSITTSVVCPDGYICFLSPGTPQNGFCPAGYTCEVIPNEGTCSSEISCI